MYIRVLIFLSFFSCLQWLCATYLFGFSGICSAASIVRPGATQEHRQAKQQLQRYFLLLPHPIGENELYGYGRAVDARTTAG